MNLLDYRQRVRQRLERELFDLVIIGGGITGASIARDAVLRGYRVALLERHDLGWGTSSRSSRLIHGGLRYLEQGNIPLVFESLSERALLARVGRHLTRPLPFVAPSYRGDRWPLAAVKAGLWAYDALALFRNYERHQRLTQAQLTRRLPGLRDDGLRGGVRYYDYRTNDARLVLENALDAASYGAAVLTRCSVEGFERGRGRLRAAIARDELDGSTLTVSGRVFISAAGPWTDNVLGLNEKGQPWVRPAKGVHLALPAALVPIAEAMIVRHPDDGRVLFFLPFDEQVVVGTTDTDYRGKLDDVRATAADVRYLLRAITAYFPGADLSEANVIATWAGVRPLLADEHGQPSALSREHRIAVLPDRLMAIAGGKLTTYRRMAAETLDRAHRNLAEAGADSPAHRCRTHRIHLPGARGIRSDVELINLAQTLGKPFGKRALDVGRHLATTYGTRGRELLALCAAEPALADPMTSDLPMIWAEVVFAARHELALSLTDVLVRRTHVFYRDADQGLAIAATAADLLSTELEWNRDERRWQIDAYRREVQANRSWQVPIASDRTPF